MGRPLDNIKVIDFTHLLPGELTSAILCDMGANLTRVEKLKPGLAQHLPPIVKGESLYFWSVHRDEKRIALDLKSEKGIEVVSKLVKDADVVVENFRPGVMSRLGLGFGKLHKLNPRLVYCSISAYGQTTSFSQRPGHDVNLQAESGVMHVSRTPDGTPLMPGTLLSDYMTALLASVSILGAILEREKSGKGKHLDLSMFDSIIWTQALAATASLYMNEEPREADPNYRHDLANYNVFRCKDGRFVAAAPLEPQFWSTFCQRLGRNDLLNVLPFGPNKDMHNSIAKEFESKTLAEWMEIFRDSDCCVSPVNTVAEAMEFLPAKERNLVQYLVHPKLGKVPQIRTPLPFEKRQDSELQAKHDVAASSVEVLKELGYKDSEIAELSHSGIIPGRPKAHA
jgi:crotonobetainyl-CoA:carnitine CoA-transferase CaiB-like acyl-CoA transferase